VVFKQQLWIFGGYGGVTSMARSCLGDLWTLDLDSLQFSSPATQGQPPKPREGHSGSLVESHLMLIAGGRDHSVYFDDIHILDLNTMCWSLVSNNVSKPACLQSRLCNHLAAAVESAPSFKFFVFGGQSCEGKNRLNWNYDGRVRCWNYFFKNIALQC
jgi:hypothetical protein